MKRPRPIWRYCTKTCRNENCDILDGKLSRFGDPRAQQFKTIQRYGQLDPIACCSPRAIRSNPVVHHHVVIASRWCTAASSSVQAPSAIRIGLSEFPHPTDRISRQNRKISNSESRQTTEIELTSTKSTTCVSSRSTSANVVQYHDCANYMYRSSKDRPQ